METYSILEAAATAGVPVAVLRVVADSLDRVLPNLNRALDDAGGLDGRKALRVALGSPVRTAKLLAANKRAMQRLGKALEIVLKARCFAESATLCQNPRCKGRQEAAYMFCCRLYEQSVLPEINCAKA